RRASSAASAAERSASSLKVKRCAPATSAVLPGKRRALSARNDSTRTLKGSGDELHLARLELAGDVVADGADRVQVFRQHLVVLHFDAEGRLEEAHELEHAGRVDDPGVEQRRVMRDGVAVVAKQKVLADETAHGQ